MISKNSKQPAAILRSGGFFMPMTPLTRFLFKATIFSVVGLILSACRKDAEIADGLSPTPELDAVSLLVVHHDGAGEIREYLVLEKIPETGAVQVTPFPGADEVWVTVLGRKRADLLQRDFAVSSKGPEAKVSVIFEKGLAVSLSGQGMHSPGPLGEAERASLNADLKSGQKSSETVETLMVLPEVG